jgi:hypothetical protein
VAVRHRGQPVRHGPQAYLGLQFKWRPVFWFGQFEARTGGTGGLTGRYSDHPLRAIRAKLSLGSTWAPYRAPAAQGRPASAAEISSADGDVIKRYNFSHRLGVRFSPTKLQCGRLWADGRWFSGQDRSRLDAGPHQPVGFLLLSKLTSTGGRRRRQRGSSAATCRWRAFPRRHVPAPAGTRTTSSTRIADAPSDLSPTAGRSRLSAFAAGAAAQIWRALYTQASTLAFRTTNPYENFVDGQRRHRAAPARHGPTLGLAVTIPVRGTGRSRPISPPAPGRGATLGPLPRRPGGR